MQDLPCPVLIRELMVWCWQQEPDDRPNADKVISTATADQFLRLADAIRINNFSSQVQMGLTNRGTFGSGGWGWA